MNNEKLNSTPKLSIAKREIFRICKDPVYFFCMLVAPTICGLFSFVDEGGFAYRYACCGSRSGRLFQLP